MKGLDQIIIEHPFFAGLPADYAQLVAGCGRMAVYKKGEFLFKVGGEAQDFFLIRHGRVALELHIPGRTAFRFGTLSEGEIVGWSWLFEPHRWQFDARAIEDTRVVSFDGACLRGKCDDDPRLGYDIMKRFAQILVRRFSDTRLQLIDVYGKQPSTSL